MRSPLLGGLFYLRLSMPQKTYVIIGQGLAGTFLSMQMAQRGIAHVVVDEHAHSRSSHIAAGLINPIVLKRLKWVQQAELFLPTVEPFYEAWERKLSLKFFHKTELWHLFKQAGQVNQWQEQSTLPYFKNHLGPVGKNLAPPLTQDHFGYGVLKNIFWVNTSLLLNAYRDKLRQKSLLKERTLKANQLTPSYAKDYLRLENVHFVICTGHLARQANDSLAKAFTPTKGEVLLVKAPKLPEHCLWHSKVFALPLGQQVFKIGATYSHQDFTDEPSTKGHQNLIKAFEQIYEGPYQVLEHLAGVRPNIKDRKPILGKLNAHVSIFNGLGSRGTLMGPYLSGVMTDFLALGKAIPEQWNVQRFT
jgi:glycine/D-amino acid oxidase-like deaminating enzyme